MDQELIQEIKSKSILHLNARNFKCFPEEFRENGLFTEEIYLKWNYIASLPVWLGASLKNLTNLYLSNNCLHTLPPEMVQLERLEVLYLDNNQIAVIPNYIGQLFRLTTLSASGNLLQVLPKEVCLLQRLQILLLAENMLEGLPDELCACAALEEVVLDGNCLLCLPRAMVYLPRLSHLSVARNRLHFLPALPFTAKTTLNITGNPQLNYAVYELLYQKISNFMTHEQKMLHITSRCDSWEVIRTLTNCLQVHTLCSNTGTLLYLPLNLQSYNGDLTKQQVPSLLEASLRVVYKMHFCHEIRVTSDNLDAHYEMSRVCKYDRTVHNFCSIPATIWTAIEQGPVALCFSQKCQNAIFTEAAGCILHTNITGVSHCVLFFCSTQCACDVFIKSLTHIQQN